MQYERKDKGNHLQKNGIWSTLPFVCYVAHQPDLVGISHQMTYYWSYGMQIIES